MKLYLAHGNQWCGTQADAKAAQGDNSYEHVEVPVDKPSLLAWLNANWSPSDHAEEAPAEPVEREEDDERYDDAVLATDHVPAASTAKERHVHEGMEGKANGYCARCGRTAQGYKWLAGGNTLDGIREAIETLEERFQLNAVVDAVEERGKVLQFNEEIT